MKSWSRLAAAASAAGLLFAPVMADMAHVAVASNFAEPAMALKQKFEASGTHQIHLVTGSTGKLYAQILNGAPYDIFLSADELRPRLLEEADKSLPDSRFTYAIGRLAVWSLRPLPEGGDLIDLLTDDEVRRIAIPNPELAPFGFAALEVITQLGIADEISGKLVYAENVGQAFAFVATGNADAGFISTSHLAARPPDKLGVSRLLPTELHQPVRQDAVALSRADGNEAAQTFLAFLKDDQARAVISGYGYLLAPL